MYLYLQVFMTESVAWLVASGFCYTINTGLLLELLLDILILPCVMEIQQHWICRTCLFMCFTDRRWGGCCGCPTYTIVPGSVIAGLVKTPALPSPHHLGELFEVVWLVHSIL